MDFVAKANALDHWNEGGTWTRTFKRGFQYVAYGSVSSELTAGPRHEPAVIKEFAKLVE